MNKLMFNDTVVDKTGKYKTLEEFGGGSEIPMASTTEFGVVKIGDGIMVENGIISVASSGGAWEHVHMDYQTYGELSLPKGTYLMVTHNTNVPYDSNVPYNSNIGVCIVGDVRASCLSINETQPRFTTYGSGRLVVVHMYNNQPCEVYYKKLD